MRPSVLVYMMYESEACLALVCVFQSPGVHTLAATPLSLNELLTLFPCADWFGPTDRSSPSALCAAHCAGFGAASVGRFVRVEGQGLLKIPQWEFPLPPV
eukprot:GHVU01112876.1.p1 GENE.GHVU01112876.1~~GHVU01112876.1.p1  ORF type:complete len:100 (+),score=3.70 GHVU01112876.1:359-658(+)